jgi:hypothetical protein
MLVVFNPIAPPGIIESKESRGGPEGAIHVEGRKSRILRRDVLAHGAGRRSRPTPRRPGFLERIFNALP